VEVDGHIPVGPKHLARRGHAPEHGVDLCDGAQRAHRAGGIHLHRGQADIHLGLDGLGDAARVVAADPAIHADAVANGSPEQLVHRNPKSLALDVPQRLVDARYGAAEDRTTAVEAALRKNLPVILDACGVAADEMLGELCNHRAHGIRVSFEARLAPANDTGVRLDPHEQPPRGHEERLDPANSHGRQLLR